MKKRTCSFLCTVLVTLLLVGFQTLNSCKKSDPDPTIDSVVKMAPVLSLKSGLAKAATLDDLPNDVKAASTSIEVIIDANEMVAFSAADLDKEVAAIEARLTLSAAETTSLKANDPYTYNAVINRMLISVSFVTKAEVGKHHESMKSNPVFIPFLISTDGSKDNMYESNYYQGVQDLQKFTRDNIIPMLRSIQKLKSDALKSATLTPVLKAHSLKQQQVIAAVITMIIDKGHTVNEAYLNMLRSQHEGGSGK